MATITPCHDRPTVLLRLDQRDGLCGFIATHLTGHLSPVVKWDELSETRRRMEDCAPILDLLDWSEVGGRDGYVLPVDTSVLRVARALRPDIEATIADDLDDPNLLERDRAALSAIDAIEEAR